eukprot:TRINITY_DN6087_c0_g1_i1.p1 TRINITY_DN6087_c0_g1~~TRINITY_DN6087_c0_g1_i1.p1  ORF type:complete len:562 (+),score=143.99 TRINITY_DN6087_c0_g1_i1:1-1686(+)
MKVGIKLKDPTRKFKLPKQDARNESHLLSPITSAKSTPRKKQNSSLDFEDIEDDSIVYDSRSKKRKHHGSSKPTTKDSTTKRKHEKEPDNKRKKSSHRPTIIPDSQVPNSTNESTTKDGSDLFAGETPPPQTFWEWKANLEKKIEEIKMNVIAPNSSTTTTPYPAPSNIPKKSILRNSNSEPQRTQHPKRHVSTPYVFDNPTPYSFDNPESMDNEEEEPILSPPNMDAQPFRGLWVDDSQPRNEHHKQEKVALEYKSNRKSIEKQQQLLHQQQPRNRPPQQPNRKHENTKIMKNNSQNESINSMQSISPPSSGDPPVTELSLEEHAVTEDSFAPSEVTEENHHHRHQRHTTHKNQQEKHRKEEQLQHSDKSELFEESEKNEMFTSEDDELSSSFKDIKQHDSIHESDDQQPKKIVQTIGDWVHYILWNEAIPPFIIHDPQLSSPSHLTDSAPSNANNETLVADTPRSMTSVAQGFEISTFPTTKDAKNHHKEEEFDEEDTRNYKDDTLDLENMTNLEQAKAIIQEQHMKIASLSKETRYLRRRVRDLTKYLKESGDSRFCV